MKFLALFLLFSTAALGQSSSDLYAPISRGPSSTTVAQGTKVAEYASRQILLVDSRPGTEAVLPMIFVTDGKSHLEFIPTRDIKESLEKGGRPVALGDILTLLSQATEKINQLQAENDRLWKVAMKDAPKPQTVIVQSPPPAQVAPSEADIAAQQQAEANARRQQAIQTWMMLQNANRTQNLNVNVTNCTRYPALCAGR